MTFGADGLVQKCEVVDSSVSPELAAHTADFITKHWRSQQNAGVSIVVPIVFAPVGWHFPRPGYPTRARLAGIQGSFVVSVTFNDKGRAVKCDVLPTTVSPLLVKPVCDFILANWCSRGFSGKTEPVPFNFRLVQ